MNKLFGIIGWSGSGKTDLICRLISSYKKKKNYHWLNQTFPSQL